MRAFLLPLSAHSVLEDTEQSMPYRFGRRSLAELAGVHPRLVDVSTHALSISPVDFACHDGVREDHEQMRLFQKGASKLNGIPPNVSKHQIQDDGFAHAVDLVPYINGKLRWEWGPIYEIAKAMRRAGDRYGVQLRWGGIWSELTGTVDHPERLVANYVAKRRSQNRRAFIDGPHFEIMNP